MPIKLGVNFDDFLRTPNNLILKIVDKTLEYVQPYSGISIAYGAVNRERVKLSFPAKWLSKWHFLKAYRLSRIYMSIPDRSTPGIAMIVAPGK